MKRACIVGFGNIGPVHAAALDQLSSAQWYGVCDIDPQKLQRAADRPDVRKYQSYSEVLADPQVDAVHLCTPHDLHAPMTEQALNAGKDVVLEKPAAINLQELEKLKDTIEHAANRVCVMLQNRHNACVVKLKSITAKKSRPLGACGFLTWKRDAAYYASAGWRGKLATEGGALLINQAIHLLDLMQYFCGTPIGVKGNTFTHVLEHVIEAEDTAESVLWFPDGCRGMFYATNAFSADMPFRLELVYPDVTYRYSDGFLYEIRQNAMPQVIAADHPAKTGKSVWGSAHESVLRAFYNNEPGYGTIQDAYNAHRLVYAIYQSAAQSGQYIEIGGTVDENDL